MLAAEMRLALHPWAKQNTGTLDSGAPRPNHPTLPCLAGGWEHHLSPVLLQMRHKPVPVSWAGQEPAAGEEECPVLQVTHGASAWRMLSTCGCWTSPQRSLCSRIQPSYISEVLSPCCTRSQAAFVMWLLVCCQSSTSWTQNHNLH